MPIKQNKNITIEKITTQEGEITVNLNLNIKIDDSELKILTHEDCKNKNINKNKIKFEESEDEIPDEIFDIELPNNNNFGKKINL